MSLFSWLAFIWLSTHPVALRVTLVGDSCYLVVSCVLSLCIWNWTASKVFSNQHLQTCVLDRRATRLKRDVALARPPATDSSPQKCFYLSSFVQVQMFSHAVTLHGAGRAEQEFSPRPWLRPLRCSDLALVGQTQQGTRLLLRLLFGTLWPSRKVQLSSEPKHCTHTHA